MSWLVGGSFRGASAEFLRSQAVNPEDVMIERETVREALACMRPRYREAVVMRYLEEMTYQEIGDEMGVTRERARQMAERGKWQARWRLLPCKPRPPLRCSNEDRCAAQRPDACGPRREPRSWFVLRVEWDGWTLVIL